MGKPSGIMNRNRVFSALRKLGFKRTTRSDDVIIYEKQVDQRRRVDVQIWSDGMMRASSAFNGCSDTAPTEFGDVPGLLDAVNHESTRMDGKYSQPGTTHADA